MKYRCGSKSEKIEGCPIAVAKTKPEVDCERFIEEEAHPSFALITKEGIRKEFYQTDALCVSCENCLE